MANFCKDCGSPIKEGAKFCAVCGTKVDTQNVEQVIPINEDPISPYATAKTVVPTAERDKEPQQTKPPIQTAAKQAVTAAASQVQSKAAQVIQTPLSSLTEQLASSQPGEAVLGTFGDVSSVVANFTEILNPFKTLMAGFKSFGQNFVGIFKNKNWVKIIIAGAIAVAWIVLMILSYNGINIGVLNWLIFAQGGAGRSVPGWIGGLLGKTTVATMLFSLLSGGFKSLGRGFKSLFSGANFKTGNLGSLLLGAGGALIVYQFFAGSTTLIDTMPAISGALLSVQALGSGNGFIYRMAQSLTARVSGNTRLAQSEKVSGLLSGITYGFTLGALVSSIPFGWLPVILGGACVIAGIVLTIVFGNKKEAAAA